MSFFASTDWAVVFATIFGPIIAVLFTFWYQKASTLDSTKHNLFAAMMKTRLHPTSTEFAGSLNLVPIYFSSQKNVMLQYTDLMKLFNDSSWSASSSPEVIYKLNEQVRNKVAYLLSAMSVTLGMKIDQLTILNGAYAPQGWSEEENARQRMRNSIQSLIDGNNSLKIEVIPISEPMKNSMPISENLVANNIESNKF